MKSKKEVSTALPPRIHIDEYLFSVKMTDVQKAGFKAHVKGKEWMRLSEWKEAMEQYIWPTFKKDGK